VEVLTIANMFKATHIFPGNILIFNAVLPFADTQSARIYGFLTFIVAIGFLVFFNKAVAVYQEVLKLLIIIFGGGFGSGFGFKGYLDRKKK
jgi:hypothetical protein